MKGLHFELWDVHKPGRHAREHSAHLFMAVMYDATQMIRADWWASSRNGLKHEFQLRYQIIFNHMWAVTLPRVVGSRRLFLSNSHSKLPPGTNWLRGTNRGSSPPNTCPLSPPDALCEAKIRCCYTYLSSWNIFQPPRCSTGENSFSLSPILWPRVLTPDPECRGCLLHG